MEKKTNRRQMAVVSLSDYNQKQIDDLHHEQNNMTQQFDNRKEGTCAHGPVALPDIFDRGCVHP